MISFSLFRTKYCVYFSFLLFNAIIFLFSTERLLLEFYTACLLHEIGHILAVYIMGMKISEVSFSGGGIRMRTTKTAMCSDSGGAFVLLSGPAVNILLFALFKAFGASGSFAIVNLTAGLYNLLPFSCLDGGALINVIITGTIHEQAWRKLLSLLKIMIIAAAVWIYWSVI